MTIHHLLRPAALTVAALLAAGASRDAAAQAWTVVPEATQLHWEARHFDTSTVRGRFERLEARLSFDATARRGELSVSVATASVSTGLAPFDTILRGGPMFDARIHPMATFVSRRFEFDGDRLVAVSGDLTVKDIVRPVTLKALRFGCRPAVAPGTEVCGGDFEAEVKRSDFGIHYGSPFAADRVRLFVSVQARRD